MKNIKPRIRGLGIYQIAGGIIGIGVTFWYLLNLNSTPGFLMMLLILFAFGLYAYSIYCGALLLKNARKGLIHSRVNQLLQVASFAMFGYAFQYVSGVYFFIGIDFTESILFKFNMGLSTWQIYISTGNPDLAINLNVVALLLISVIEKLLKSVKQAEKNQQVADIGKIEDAVSNT